MSPKRLIGQTCHRRHVPGGGEYISPTETVRRRRRTALRESRARERAKTRAQRQVRKDESGETGNVRRSRKGVVRACCPHYDLRQRVVSAIFPASSKMNVLQRKACTGCESCFSVADRSPSRVADRLPSRVAVRDVWTSSVLAPSHATTGSKLNLMRIARCRSLLCFRLSMYSIWRVLQKRAWKCILLRFHGHERIRQALYPFYTINRNVLDFGTVILIDVGTDNGHKEIEPCKLLSSNQTGSTLHPFIHQPP